MTHLFSLDNATCAYGKKEVLHNLNISIEPGLFYGLAGPNGSGKTTLLDVLLGNKKTISGSVLFKNTSVTDFFSVTVFTYLIKHNVGEALWH